MTKVTGAFAAVDGFPTEGTIFARSTSLRPGATNAVTKETRTAPIVDGKFTFETITPGPVQFTVVGNHATHDVEVTVPEKDEVNFLDLLSDAYDYPEPIVLAAQAAARQARADADKSARIAQAFGGVEMMDKYSADAKASADSAASSKTAAASSATAAKTSETNAASSATAASSSKTAAASSATAAKASETTARISETNAKTSETNATTSATNAANSANQAANIANSTTWNDDVLTVNSKSSPHLRGPQGIPGPPGPVTTVNGSSISATPTIETLDLKTLLNAGITADRLEIVRSGNMCVLYVENLVRSGSTSSYATLTNASNIPDNFRPVSYTISSALIEATSGSNSEATALVSLSTYGTLQVSNHYPATNSVRGQLVYISKAAVPVAQVPKGDPDGSAWANITGKPDFDSLYAQKSHYHNVSDLPDLQAQLDRKADVTSLSRFLPSSMAMSQPTPNAVVQRDDIGDVLVPVTTNANAAVNKGYVDTQITANKTTKPIILEANLTSAKAMPANQQMFTPFSVLVGSDQGTLSSDQGNFKVNTAGYYRVDWEFPFVDFFTGNASHVVRVKPDSVSNFAPKKFALVEASSNWDRTDTATWTIYLQAGDSIYVAVTPSSGTAGGYNKNYGSKATLTLTRIA